MKKQHLFSGYVLIGIGVYFLMKHLELPLFKSFYSWPTFFIILGIAFLIHSYATNDNQNIFTGVLLLGLGIHFHGLENYSFWYSDWSIYVLIVGLAFLIRYFKTKTGIIPSFTLIGIALFMIFSVTLPESFQGIYIVIDFIETFWPVVLIVIGIYFIRFKK